MMYGYDQQRNALDTQQNIAAQRAATLAGLQNNMIGGLGGLVGQYQNLFGGQAASLSDMFWLVEWESGRTAEVEIYPGNLVYINKQRVRWPEEWPILSGCGRARRIDE